VPQCPIAGDATAADHADVTAEEVGKFPYGPTSGSSQHLVTGRCTPDGNQLIWLHNCPTE
jgi:hypothetical protein